MNNFNWKQVSVQRPCEHCGRTRWCQYSDEMDQCHYQGGPGAIEKTRPETGETYYLYPKNTNGRSEAKAPADDIPAQDPPALAAPDLCDKVYTSLLDALALTSAHRNDLRQRGLDDDSIKRNKYRSYPLDGRGDLVQRLLETYTQDTLLSVPGFYVKDGKTRIAGAEGLLVPVRDEDGRITALKVRADDPKPGQSKYTTLSAKRYGGHGPGAPLHFPLGIQWNGPIDRLIIVEGEFKAEIAALKLNCHALAIPGVDAWPKAVEWIKQRQDQPKQLDIAFDMDLFTNVNVLGPLGKLYHALKDIHPDIGILEWAPDKAKGLDDALLAGAKIKRNTGDYILGLLQEADMEITKTQVKEKQKKKRQSRAAASDEDIAKMIEEMNQEFAVVHLSGNVRVARIYQSKQFGVQRRTIDYLQLGDFQLWTRNRRIMVQRGDRVVDRSAGDVWLEHPNRRTYSSVLYLPGIQLEDSNILNLWSGWPYEPKQGDWSLLQNHIREVICAGNEAHYNYHMCWMADIVQNPTLKPGTAIVLRGKQGTGKGVYCNAFGKLFGQHFLHISHAHHLTGHFNAQFQDCSLIFADEAIWAGDKSAEGVLKSMVSESDIVLEAKGRNPIRADNHLHLMFASNNDWVIPAGLEERRFAVFDVLDIHEKDYAYFKAIQDQLEHGGYEAMLYDLMHHHINIQLRDIPKTDALLQQKHQTMNPIDSLWHEILFRGFVFRGDEGWPEWINKQRLYDEYIRQTGRRGTTRRSGECKFWNRILELCQGIRAGRETDIVYDELGRPMIDEGNIFMRRQQRVIYLPPLQTCREAFDLITGQPEQWPAITSENEDADPVDDPLADGAPPF